MKKFFTTGTVLLFIWSLIIYILLFFVEDIFSPKDQLEGTILLLSHLGLSLLMLSLNYLEVLFHNQQERNRDILLDMIAVLKGTNAFQEDLARKLGNLTHDAWTTKCAVDRIENQTKPKTSTPRKKKEA